MSLPEPVRWVLAALAVYRLSQLVAYEDGPFGLVRRFRAWVANRSVRWDPLREMLGDLVHCPYCLAVWFAAGAAVLALWPTVGGDVALAVLGLAGAQVFLQDVTNGGDDGHGN